VGAIAIVVEVVESPTCVKPPSSISAYTSAAIAPALGLETFDETVHELAPGPEAVAGGSPTLGKAG